MMPSERISSIIHFAQNEVSAWDEYIDHNDAFPEELLKRMREVGLFGLTTPLAYSGLGLSVDEKTDVDQALGYASPAVAGMIAISNGLIAPLMMTAGTEAQRNLILPSIAQGADFGAFCLTERGGSGVAILEARLTNNGAGYDLVADKLYCTMAPLATWFLVACKIDGQSGRQGIAISLVNRNDDGVVVQDKHRKMGLRGVPVADVSFKCHVPKERVIVGAVGAIESALNSARLYAAASYVGVSRRILSEMVHASDRMRRAGKVVTERETVQAAIGRIQLALLAASATVRSATEDLTAGNSGASSCAAAKVLSTDCAGQAADVAMQILGASGYFEGTAIERLFRDVRASRIFEGTNEVLTLMLGQKAIENLRMSSLRRT